MREASTLASVLEDGLYTKCWISEGSQRSYRVRSGNNIRRSRYYNRPLERVNSEA